MYGIYVYACNNSYTSSKVISADGGFWIVVVKTFYLITMSESNHMVNYIHLHSSPKIFITRIIMQAQELN